MELTFSFPLYALQSYAYLHLSWTLSFLSLFLTFSGQVPHHINGSRFLLSHVCFGTRTCLPCEPGYWAVVHCVVRCIYPDVSFVLLPDRGLWFDQSLQVSDSFQLKMLQTQVEKKKRFNKQRKWVKDRRKSLRPDGISLMEATSNDVFLQYSPDGEPVSSPKVEIVSCSKYK